MLSMVPYCHHIPEQAVHDIIEFDYVVISIFSLKGQSLAHPSAVQTNTYSQ